MKCIHFYNPVNRIARVSDEEAYAAVKAGKAHYVAKSFWKKKVRDIGNAAAA